ncbi:MAG: hypothetical protein O3A63_15415 [Proteobacteria bacterium]|nr:hypothetical protein [Pseudomonadota bacterium]
MSLIARHLENHGIATVIMGCARDIVEQAGVPRFLFSDFPLGNSAGRPHDAASQEATLDLALQMFESADQPGTTAVNPLKWADDESWKYDFMNVDALSHERIEQLKADFVQQKATAMRIKQTSK